MRIRSLAWVIAWVIPWAVAVVSLGAAPGTAHADTDEDTEAARIHYKAGEQYYVRGDYAKAIGEFREAYRLSKAAALLYNISQAHERNGELVPARDYLQKYVDSGETEAGELPALKEKLASLNKRIASGDKPEKPPEKPPIKPPLPTDDLAERGPSRPFKTWKWVTIGVGSGLLLVASLAAIDGQKQEQRLEDNVSDPPGTTYDKSLDDIYQRGKRDNAAAVICGIGGVALAATGVIFFILDARDSERPTTHARLRPVVSPVLGPGVAGAAAVWSF